MQLPQIKCFKACMRNQWHTEGILSTPAFLRSVQRPTQQIERKDAQTLPVINMKRKALRSLPAFSFWRNGPLVRGASIAWLIAKEGGKQGLLPGQPLLGAERRGGEKGRKSRPRCSSCHNYPGGGRRRVVVVRGDSGSVQATQPQASAPVERALPCLPTSRQCRWRRPLAATRPRVPKGYCSSRSLQTSQPMRIIKARAALVPTTGNHHKVRVAAWSAGAKVSGRVSGWDENRRARESQRVAQEEREGWGARVLRLSPFCPGVLFM